MDIRHLGLNNSNIMSHPRPASPLSRPPRPSLALPAFALYGEPHRPGQPDLPDLLHVETIAERSRLHDWEIRPHRHEALFQILIIRRGALQLTLDGRPQRRRGPCAITVPPMVVHGFQFAPAVDGMVITVAAGPLQALVREPTADDVAWRQALPRLQVLAPVGAAVLQAARRLRDDHATAGPWRALALDIGLRRLLLELARTAAPDAVVADEAVQQPALRHVRRFQALVEAHYRRQPLLAELAGRLGITTTQLNRVCHRVLGQSALSVLHARLLLEAERELGYTTRSIKQVALGLGFSDAGYFTRFFQRHSGRTPSAWRAGQ